MARGCCPRRLGRGPQDIAVFGADFRRRHAHTEDHTEGSTVELDALRRYLAGCGSG